MPIGSFENPITGGGGSLVIPKIQSPNFSIANQTGWAIFADGTAYFFNVTAAGTITGGTLIVDGPTGGVFIYSGTPANGNLIGSWAGQAGTDAHGNQYPAGLSVNQGAITGASITGTTITNSVFQGDILTNSTMSNPNIQGGNLTETKIVFDNNGGVLLVYATNTTTITQNVAGTYSFTAPTGVTQAHVECWASGAGGNGGTSSLGGHGGGGSEYAAEPIYPLVPGNVYSYTVGAGGIGSSTGGGDGGDGDFSFFDNGGVLAFPGLGNGTAGSGSTNTVHNNGGSSPSAGANTGGSSGGNSGNATAAGNPGNAPSGATGGAQPAAQTGSGRGGAGGNSGANGSSGGSPGAGGGGAGKGTSTTTKSLTYTPVWNGSYYGPDSDPSVTNQLRSTSTMFQGGETASGGGFNGNQRCVFRFNQAQIATDFAGYTITNCTITVTNQHSWFNSGMTIEFDKGSVPGTLQSSWPGGMSQIVTGTIAEGATHTFGMGASTGSAFVAGTINALGFGANVPANNPYNLNYYGYFSSGSAIKLTITGTIGAGSTTAGNGSDGQVQITYSSGTTLLCSVAPAAGTDSFGNSYNAGVWTYGASGSAVGMIPSGSNTAMALKPGVTPAAISGTSLMYGTSSGGVNLVDGGDLSTYAVGRRTIILGSNTPVAASPGTSVWSTTGTVRSYRIHGQIYISISGAAQQVSLGVGLPSGTGHFATILSRATALIATTDFANNTLTALGGTGTLAVGNTYVILLDGVANVTSGGNIVITLAGTNANDITVLTNSFVEFEPV